ncbi:MAG: hypothetical protein M3R17_01075 [Bacteroidota bacterium]|nr:hypothetical protein [Bacteroidota bacterium]
MIRALIIVVNLIIVAIFRLFVSSPYAEIKSPSTVKAGEAFLVEVSISTDGETDFMRYSMEFPSGWLVEKVEAAGSTFKYEKNTAKFLWSRVGEVKELNISYRVTPPLTATGDFTMNCKLSHTVDNLPANIQLPPMTVNVTGNSGASEKLVADSTAKPPVHISIDRFVPADEVTDEFVVSIVINKDDLKSFGKVEDTLPAGFSAKVIKADGADFKFENGVVKFSWFVMPVKQVLNVQYRVTIDPSVSGAQTIGGHFSYVENETGKLMAISPSVIRVKEQPVVVNTTDNPTVTTTTDNPTGNTTGTATDNTVKTTDNTTGTATDNTTVKTTDNTTSTATDNTTVKTTDNTSTTTNDVGNTTVNTDNSSAKSGALGVNYSVQIAAFTRMLPVSYFKEAFSFSATVNAEQHNGLNKYTTGSFSSYQSARDNRNQVRNNGITDAFVIAYNNGKRITVQEALMITNQKWIQ